MGRPVPPLPSNGDFDLPVVMPGLCRASTSFLTRQRTKAWMAGTSPAMTVREE